MKQKVRVAAAQIDIFERKNIKKHVENIIECIMEAGENNTDIICFPETCLYSLMGKYAPSEKDIDYYINKIRSACKKNKIMSLITSFVSEGGKIYSRSYLLSKKGEILHKYDKVFLWPSERKYVAQGDKNKVINTEIGKIATITCYDISSPEYCLELARAGAEIFLVPSFLVEYSSLKAKQTIELHRALGPVRAFETAAFWIKTDAVCDTTIGYSSISGPGEVLAETTVIGKPEMVYSDLHSYKLQEYRQYMNIELKNDFLNPILPRL